MKGVEKLVIRAKHGPSKDELANSPRYAKFRLHQSEFSGAGKAATHISNAIFAIRHLADTGSIGKLTRICQIIQKTDPTNHLGKRSILFSVKGGILKGFNLNKNNPFDTVVNNPLSYSFSRAQSLANVELPPLHPDINLQNPWKLPLFRFILCLGVIPDMVKSGDGYAPVNPLLKLNPVQLQTPWFSSKSIFCWYEPGT